MIREMEGGVGNFPRTDAMREPGGVAAAPQEEGSSHSTSSSSSSPLPALTSAPSSLSFLSTTQDSSSSPPLGLLLKSSLPFAPFLPHAHPPTREGEGMGVSQSFRVIHSYMDTWTSAASTRDGAVHLDHVYGDDAAPAVAATSAGPEGGRGAPSLPVQSYVAFDTDPPLRHSPAVLGQPVPRPPPPVLYPPPPLPAPAQIPSLSHESPASDFSLPLLTPTQNGPLCHSTLAGDPPYSYLLPGLNPFLPRPTADLNPPPPWLALALPQHEDPHKQGAPRSARRTSPRLPQALPERPLTSEPPDEAPKGALEPRSGSPRDKVHHPERQDGQPRVSPHKKLHMDAVEGLEESARAVTKAAPDGAITQGVTDLACDVTNTSFDVKPYMQSGPASAVTTGFLPGEDALPDPAGAAAPGDDCQWAEDDSGCFEGMSSSSDPSTALPFLQPLPPSPASDSFGLLASVFKDRLAEEVDVFTRYMRHIQDEGPRPVISEEDQEETKHYQLLLQLHHLAAKITRLLLQY
ncbi:uncharacterized protein [Penaeus vannamei]|uniref:uncharacterized protein isoform X2 n=1 Tax=Penaeus vannamei TaxID=6689 RepID=UPI00387F786D